MDLERQNLRSSGENPEVHQLPQRDAGSGHGGALVNGNKSGAKINRMVESHVGRN